MLAAAIAALTSMSAYTAWRRSPVGAFLHKLRSA
jgi:hypothetical protein